MTIMHVAYVVNDEWFVEQCCCLFWGEGLICMVILDVFMIKKLGLII